jgi:predicted metal-dependent hydrolase
VKASRSAPLRLDGSRGRPGRDRASCGKAPLSRPTRPPERYVVELPAGAIDCRLRRSPRARRLSVTVGPAGIEIVAPLGTTVQAIAGFVDHHRHWISGRASVWLRALSGHSGSRTLANGGAILLRGERTQVSVTRGGIRQAQVAYRDGFLVAVPDGALDSHREAMIEAGLQRWLMRQAQLDARLYASRHGLRHGLVPSAVRVKNQKHLWGSCTAKGAINLNWRLIFAPRAVFEYVVVHELCHLRVRNHQRDFWRLVGEVLPDYRRERRWLKDKGHLLTLRPVTTSSVPLPTR